MIERIPLRSWEVLAEERGSRLGEGDRLKSWQFHAGDITNGDQIRRFFDGTLDASLSDDRKALRDQVHAATKATWSDPDLVALLNGLLNSALFDPLPLLPLLSIDEFTRQLVIQFSKAKDEEKVMIRRLVLEAVLYPWVHRIDRIRLSEFHRDHATDDLSALCLSGGGIRSATFSLGVIQGLAKQGLLKQFDYLSTVSGGGYTGGWLTAWIHRRFQGGDLNPVAGVESALSDNAGRPVDPDPMEVRHLRRYSNYLTPRRGVMAVDTWFALATILRNLIINWTVTLPIILALVMVPRLYMHLVVVDWGRDSLLNSERFALSIVTVAAVVALPLLLGGRGVAERSRERVHRLLTRFLAVAFLLPTVAVLWLVEPASTVELVVFVLAVTGGFGAMAYPIFQVMNNGAVWRTDPRARFLLWCFTGLAITSFATPLALAWMGNPGWLDTLPWLPVLSAADPAVRENGEAALTTTTAATFAVFAPPLFLALALAFVTFVTWGTSKIRIGRLRVSDDDREWLARAMAWALLLAIGWMALAFCVILVPWLFWRLPNFEVLLASVGGASGVIAFLGGWSGKTPAGTGGAAPSKRTLAFGQLTQVAAWVFLGAILAGFSIAVTSATNALADEPDLRCITRDEDNCREGDMVPVGPFFDMQWSGISYGDNVIALSRDLRDEHRHFDSIIRVSWQATIGIAALAVAFSIASSAFCATSNRYSLHKFYRNRIITAYLGASRAESRRNTFVDFDRDDDLAMHLLKPDLPVTGKEGGGKLFHVVCSTLNLVGGKNLAWQERRAQSFTNSRLHAGSMRLGYQRTSAYEKDIDGYPSLGTVLAYSGAAANPNMGFHTSPGVIIVMTLFNVRVGRWGVSPGPAGYGLASGNRGAKILSSLFPRILQEAFGLTSDQRSHVNLSDGGHFENMGLYEMVFRRCSNIVVVDAAQDGGSKDGKHYQFNSLSEAFRKIRIDLGVEITLDQPIEIYPGTRGQPGGYIVRGQIQYPAVPGLPGPGGEPTMVLQVGRILIVKPAVYGEEALDVVNFARKSAKFPQESTGDFWYTESQFESYRRLGEHSIAGALPSPPWEANVLNLVRGAIPAGGVGIYQ